MLDALPAAIYTTDAEGRLTYFNRAAVEFSGRVPELGTDQWCVSWKLYRADGTPMAHDQCPMAIALKRVAPCMEWKLSQKGPMAPASVSNRIRLRCGTVTETSSAV